MSASHLNTRPSTQTRTSARSAPAPPAPAASSSAAAPRRRPRSAPSRAGSGSAHGCSTNLRGGRAQPAVIKVEHSLPLHGALSATRCASSGSAPPRHRVVRPRRLEVVPQRAALGGKRGGRCAHA
jgi:hypothetical protein